MRRNRKLPVGFCINLPVVSTKPNVEGHLAGEGLKAVERTAVSNALCQSVPEPLTGPPRLTACLQNTVCVGKQGRVCHSCGMWKPHSCQKPFTIT